MISPAYSVLFLNNKLCEIANRNKFLCIEWSVLRNVYKLVGNCSQRCAKNLPKILLYSVRSSRRKMQCVYKHRTCWKRIQYPNWLFLFGNDQVSAVLHCRPAWSTFIWWERSFNKKKSLLTSHESLEGAQAQMYWSTTPPGALEPKFLRQSSSDLSCKVTFCNDDGFGPSINWNGSVNYWIPNYKIIITVSYTTPSNSYSIFSVVICCHIAAETGDWRY